MKNKPYSFSSKPHSECDKHIYGFGGDGEGLCGYSYRCEHGPGAQEALASCNDYLHFIHERAELLRGKCPHQGQVACPGKAGI